MFCKHKWKVLSEATTKSRLAELTEQGCVLDGNKHSTRLVERKYIQIVTCEKCGDLKRFVEEI